MNSQKKQLNLNNHKKSNKRQKKHVSGAEYFQINSPQMFTKSLFASKKIISMSRQNLNKHLAKKDLSKSNHFIVSEFIAQNMLDIKKHKSIIEAMLQVDKKYYCKSKDISCYKLSGSTDNQNDDHDDDNNDEHDMNNEKIGKDVLYAHACISLVSKLKPGSKVLDVGSNNGMLAVVFANLVNARGDLSKKRGSVISIDIKPEKVEKCLSNIREDTINRDLLLEDNQDNFKIIEGNGRNGYPENINKKIYDVIHISASNVEHEAPAYLKYQLKEGGLMFMPINVDGKTTIRIYQRSKGKIKFVNTKLELDSTMNDSELE